MLLLLPLPILLEYIDPNLPTSCLKFASASNIRVRGRGTFGTFDIFGDPISHFRRLVPSHQ